MCCSSLATLSCNPQASCTLCVTVHALCLRCIIENKEPFAHKEWRREPYDPRPYTPLTEYAITSKVASEVCGSLP